uniref:Uncharacterized protein n=1 Tax=Rhizophagus irregularis (strain DAOM 181602 / DAOM 197198 / MUCL 43194) TaxID=747089 RepID=U9TEJ8_RHIID
MHVPHIILNLKYTNATVNPITSSRNTKITRYNEVLFHISSLYRLGSYTSDRKVAKQGEIGSWFPHSNRLSAWKLKLQARK